MEVTKRRPLSKLKPERVQEKTMKSVDRVLKERRLCAQGETEALARKSDLKRKTESAQNKPLISVNGVQKKRRLTKVLVPAQEEPQRKPDLKKKPDCIEMPATFIDGAVKKGSTETGNQEGEKINAEKPATFIDGTGKKETLRETGNQGGKKINTELSLKIIGSEEKERALCNWRKIKFDRERQKQREAARLAVDQVKNTCGLQENMDSMRDFEKLMGCSSTFYIFSRDRKYCYD